jgi:hypothetical protein
MDSTVWAAIIGTGGVIVTVAGTLAGTVIGSRLNQSSALKTARDMLQIDRHKYTQDRLWDVRKEAYTSIIAGLRATAKAANVVNDGFHDGYMDPEEYYQSDAFGHASRDLWDKWRATKDEYERARLLLSDAFVEGFEQIEARLDAVDDEGIPPMIYATTREIFDEAVTPMLEIAKAEIAPQLPAAA